MLQNLSSSKNEVTLKLTFPSQKIRAYKTQVSCNGNIDKLQSGYLFPEIDRRKVAHMLKYPDAKVISLGIRNTTEPILQVITSAMAKVKELNMVKVVDVADNIEMSEWPDNQLSGLVANLSNGDDEANDVESIDDSELQTMALVDGKKDEVEVVGMADESKDKPSIVEISYDKDFLIQFGNDFVLMCEIMCLLQDDEW
nr:LL-diaminopimelate aminotransferase, chloroplastic [Tanacetum cinerariifolium]